jgi:hypothetical protein
VLFACPCGHVSPNHAVPGQRPFRTLLGGARVWLRGRIKCCTCTIIDASTQVPWYGIVEMALFFLTPDPLQGTPYSKTRRVRTGGGKLRCSRSRLFAESLALNPLFWCPIDFFLSRVGLQIPARLSMRANVVNPSAWWVEFKSVRAPIFARFEIRVGRRKLRPHREKEKRLLDPRGSNGRARLADHTRCRAPIQTTLQRTVQSAYLPWELEVMRFDDGG